MTVNRGSTSKLIGVAEVTFGTTPATPTMVEFPIVNFNPVASNNTVQSAQLRSHPFVDKLIATDFSHTIGLDFELQTATHDNLLQMILGDTWATNAIKAKDVLSSMSIESQVGGGSSLFNQWTGYCVGTLGISVGSGNNAPIKMTTTGMAKVASLDAGATLATAVTAAGSPVPMVFTGATATIAGVARPLTDVAINLQRQIDPLKIIGQNTPREYVPSLVQCSGTITIPYDDATQSTLFAGFTDTPIVLTCVDGNSKSYAFTVPKAKFVKFTRQIQTRGALFQQIDWTGYYDTSTATVLSIVRVP